MCFWPWFRDRPVNQVSHVFAHCNTGKAACLQYVKKPENSDDKDGFISQNRSETRKNSMYITQKCLPHPEVMLLWMFNFHSIDYLLDVSVIFTFY